MSLGVQALLALLPIALGGVLLVGFRLAARHAMPAAYLAAARRGFLVPGDVWDFPRREAWADDWVSGLEEEMVAVPGGRRVSAAMAWAPNLLVGVLLVLTRLPALPVGAGLRSVALNWPDILGTGIAATTTPLYPYGHGLTYN